jgi:hypothetical protein
MVDIRWDSINGCLTSEMHGSPDLTGASTTGRVTTLSMPMDKPSYYTEQEWDAINKDIVGKVIVKHSEFLETPMPKGAFHGTLPKGVPMERSEKSEYEPAYRRELKILDAAQLLSMAFPPRNLIMSPWLPEKGLTMIYAPRGIGKPRADLNKPWRAICEAAGLTGLHIHDLRHTFASVGAGKSLGLPLIGKLLGHSQASTTNRYAHLDADPMRRAVETIGATISDAMAGGNRIVPSKGR